MSAQPVGAQFALHDGITGKVHLLNESAAFVWDLLDGTRTVADLSRELGGRYGRAAADVEADVLEVLARLTAERLVE